MTRTPAMRRGACPPADRAATPCLSPITESNLSRRRELERRSRRRDRITDVLAMLALIVLAAILTGLHI